MLRRLPVLPLPFVLLWAWGCAPPPTQYRHSAFIPGPRAPAWDGRSPVEGTLHLEGTFAGNTVKRNVAPVEGDSAFRVPNITAEGAAFYALGDGVEVGLRVSYASYYWTEPSAEGTPPIQDQSSLWGLGPEVRVQVPFDKSKRFSLGIVANLIRYQIPWGKWEKRSANDPCPCFVDKTFWSGGGGTTYRLKEEGSEGQYLFSAGLYPSLHLGDQGEYGHVFLAVSATMGFRNDGFTNKAGQGSTLKQTGIIPIVGAGYAYTFDPIKIAAMLMMPLSVGETYVNYGPAGLLTLGYQFDIARRADVVR